MRFGAAILALGLWGGGSVAQASTCEIDDATGTLTVTMTGSGTLKVVSGVIELSGAPCGTATTTTTARIVLLRAAGTGGILTLAGRFAPGRNDVPEADEPEIEIDASAFRGRLNIAGSGRGEDWRFSAGGINFNADLDEDIALPTATYDVVLKMQGGDDHIDATAYAGPCWLHLRGGPGNDVITGSPGSDRIGGDDGNDTLYGGAGGDIINDGAGDDLVSGGPGNDLLWPQWSANLGKDDYHGGSGIDAVAYVDRDLGVTVSLDGAANDGAPDEGDNVHPDVEDIWGGHGDDVLVGSSAANYLRGLWGRNELYGGDGDDRLDVGYDAVPGSLAIGDGGNDYLFGSGGPDLLDGGDGDDELHGNAGNDTLDGGPGIDQYFGGYGADVIYNDDGIAETIDCGPDVDDPEPDPLDTFTACENI
jgi:Ca2+-binding RTX toxin-like protein